MKYPDPKKPKEPVLEFRKYAARFRLPFYLVYCVRCRKTTAHENLTNLNPTQPNPTHGSTQPMDNSVIQTGDSSGVESADAVTVVEPRLVLVFAHCALVHRVLARYLHRAHK